MDAVGIERRHRVATRLLVLVGDRAKPERRVVSPLWRIELASDEGERIERARHQRSANLLFRPSAQALLESHPIRLPSRVISNRTQAQRPGRWLGTRRRSQAAAT